ncbi:MAG: GAF domain-containing sensor histidine kinase [Anaerolineales bacterium]|nr:GAF domain-containing sensor histidine kinase [Anaerolineales bacterium]
MINRQKISWIDLQVAIARWLVYLVTVIGFVLLWLIEPTEFSLSFDTPHVSLLILFAIVYNLAMTAGALLGWMPNEIQIGSIIVDVMIAGFSYLFLVPQPTLTTFFIDPIFLLTLLPAVVTALRHRWLTGVVVAAGIGMLRSALLLLDMTGPTSSPVLLSIVWGIFFLMGTSFLCGYLAERILRLGLQREIEKSQNNVHNLEAALQREEALQLVASTLGDTLSFERAIESALDVADKAMNAWGAKQQLVGAVFLFEDGNMRLSAMRGLPRYEQNQVISGRSGIVARCLEKAELAVTTTPNDDPELTAFPGIAECRVVVSVPLRVGFESFGVMVFGTGAFDSFNQDQLDFLSSVAERATIALHNTLLYQNLQGEKNRIMRIEEDARRKLARDLHDGPTQTVSAIAMRLNFVRKMMIKEPDKIMAELEGVEELARETVKEIRHMLFTMRPLVLETQGLMSALETLAEKILQADGLKVELDERGEASHFLDAHQAGVVFHIIDEALGNARKYSNANLIQVRIWVEADLFVVEVKDDGVGFEPDKVLDEYEMRGSLGMINMRERAELINGSIDIKSAPGKGTTVTLVVPLRENDL